MRRSKELLQELRRVAERNLFSLSMEDVFSNCALGIDSTNKYLVYYASRLPVVVDVKEISSCSMNVILRNIQAGDLDHNKLEDYIVRISLRLLNNVGSKPLEIVFYDCNENEIFELPVLRQKALMWKQTINQLFSPSAGTGSHSNAATLYTI